MKNDHYQWKIKINRKKQSTNKAGAVSPWLLLIVCVMLAGIYIYCINNNATKGYQIKQIEKDIAELKKENESLQVREAELKSLYRIEESSKELNMAETVEVSYIQEKSPMALK